MKIIWLGHASFRIEIAGQVLLIDPWLDGNPMLDESHHAAALDGATHVVLTHGHSDHASEAPRICKDRGIPCIGIFDMMNFWETRHAIQTVGMNKGGTVDLGGPKLTMVNACHSSSEATPDGPRYLGHESGYMIAGEGHVIYLSGDTDIMADMDWMGDLHKPDIGILSAGGHFTMDMTRAAYAARRYFDFKTVIPCHYRTFPLLEQNADALKAGLPGVAVIEPEVMQAIDI